MFEPKTQTNTFLAWSVPSITWQTIFFFPLSIFFAGFTSFYWDRWKSGGGGFWDESTLPQSCVRLGDRLQHAEVWE